jgi:hypothetical protein
MEAKVLKIIRELKEHQRLQTMARGCERDGGAEVFVAELEER